MSDPPPFSFPTPFLHRSEEHADLDTVIEALKTRALLSGYKYAVHDDALSLFGALSSAKAVLCCCSKPCGHSIILRAKTDTSWAVEIIESDHNHGPMTSLDWLEDIPRHIVRLVLERIPRDAWDDERVRAIVGQEISVKMSSQGLGFLKLHWRTYNESRRDTTPLNASAAPFKVSADSESKTRPPEGVTVKIDHASPTTATGPADRPSDTAPRTADVKTEVVDLTGSDSDNDKKNGNDKSGNGNAGPPSCRPSRCPSPACPPPGYTPHPPPGFPFLARSRQPSPVRFDAGPYSHSTTHAPPPTHFGASPGATGPHLGVPSWPPSGIWSSGYHAPSPGYPSGTSSARPRSLLPPQQAPRVTVQLPPGPPAPPAPRVTVQLPPGAPAAPAPGPVGTAPGGADAQPKRPPAEDSCTPVSQFRVLKQTFAHQMDQLSKSREAVTYFRTQLRMAQSHIIERDATIANLRTLVARLETDLAHAKEEVTIADERVRIATEQGRIERQLVQVERQCLEMEHKRADMEEKRDAFRKRREANEMEA